MDFEMYGMGQKEKDFTELAQDRVPVVWLYE